MKKKIAHILHAVGGVDVSLRVIINNVDDTAFENIIIHGLEDTKKPYFSKTKTPIQEYKLNIKRNISPINDLIAIYKTRKIIKHEKVNLIHAHSAKGGLIARLAGLFLGITVLHTPQAYSYLSTSNKVARFVYLSVERVLKYFNSILLASSKSELNRGLNEVNYKKENTLLFNNCIQEIKTIKPLTITKTWPDNYICTVGRPSYQKRLDMMIKALFEVKKQQEEIHLVIMGVGFFSPDLEKIQKLIKNLDLTHNITLLDWTSHENIYHIVSKSKLYLSTARYEGLPYAVIEALALSKALIVTDADGNRDLVIDNHNGYIIKNESELALKIIKLLNDDALTKEFALNSKRLFNTNFNVDNNIFKLENHYKNYVN